MSPYAASLGCYYYVLKRKSNLPCHLSLFGKILDESSPPRRRFYRRYPGGARVSSRLAFFRDVRHPPFARVARRTTARLKVIGGDIEAETKVW